MNNSFQVKAADVFVTCGDFTASVCRLRNTSADNAEADGALVATSFIGTWAQPTTPEP